MAAGGDGHWVLASMWSLLLVSFVFVVLRMYTRVYVVKSFGADDLLSSHEYRFDDHWRTIWPGPESNGYLGRGARPLTTITTLRSCQPNVCDNSHEYRKMVFGSLSTTTRQEKWHKIAIWCMMACLISASIAVCFVYWFQCTPPEYLWNRKIPGRCHIDTAPVSLTLCSES
ncbi:hypothetical protein SNK04_005447 [Fusarium graminearum]